MQDGTENDGKYPEHEAARPLRWVKDNNGHTWLCDKDVDPDGDLSVQDCWRCEEMAFPMGGR
jgi:hypothetical protein